MTDLTRRQFSCLIGGGAVMLTPLAGRAWASENGMTQAVKTMFGEAEIKTGRVSMTLPPLSENGYSVSMSVTVDSPMTSDDYVERVAIFSERNPIPLIASYSFTPSSGRAEVSTNIRLGGSQRVHAFAQMNDGSVWSGGAETLVTLAACVIL